MTKQLMIGAAIGALMISGAVAQSPSSAPSSATPPSAAQTAPSGSAQFIASQKPDQWVASKFKGTNVMGSDNQKVGDISDILFDKTGKIEAFIVSVGGFLGMGAKEVAMAPSSFEVIPGENSGSPVLKTALTQDQLKNAQAFARYEPPRPAATTGTGGSSNRGLRPSSNTGPSGQ